MCRILGFHWLESRVCRFGDECHLVRECIKCRFCSPVGHGLALPRPWAKHLAAHHGGTISSPSVRAADKRFGYRRHKVPISSTLGVDFVAALPRFRFPIQPWLSVAHSLEKLFSTRHWNNEILALPGSDRRGSKLPVPKLSDTGRKLYSMACLGDLSRRRT